jgi:hypothetical protein
MHNCNESIVLSRAGMLAMWAGWIVGPLAWAAHQNLSYGLTYWICGAGTGWPVYVATVLALAAAAGAGFVSWRFRQAAWRTRLQDGHAKAASRGRFVATVGVLISALSATGIVVETIPVLFLDACAGAT